MVFASVGRVMTSSVYFPWVLLCVMSFSFTNNLYWDTQLKLVISGILYSFQQVIPQKIFMSFKLILIYFIRISTIFLVNRCQIITSRITRRKLITWLTRSKRFRQKYIFINMNFKWILNHVMNKYFYFIQGSVYRLSSSIR